MMLRRRLFVAVAGVCALLLGGCSPYSLPTWLRQTPRPAPPAPGPDDPLALEEAWQVSIDHVFMGIATDRDSDEIILFTGDGRVTRWSRQGKLVDEVEVRTRTQGSYLSVARLQQGSPPGFVISGVWSKSVLAVDHHGSLLWEHRNDSGVDSIAAADLDGDGLDEVAIGYNAGGLDLLGPDGSLRWHMPSLGNVWSVAVAPTGDRGELEILTPGRWMNRVRRSDRFGSWRELDLNKMPLASGLEQRAPMRRAADLIGAAELKPGRPVIIITDYAVHTLSGVDPAGTLLWQRSFPENEHSIVWQHKIASEGPYTAFGMHDGRALVHDGRTGARLASVLVDHPALVAWLPPQENGAPLLVVAAGGTLRAYRLVPRAVRSAAWHAGDRPLDPP
jgi:hypothetical protein